MTASSRGVRVATSLLRSSRHPRICTECINHLTTTLPRRTYSIAATSLKTLSPTPDSELHHLKSTPPISPSPSTSTPYITKAGIVLSRPPLLTKPLSAFEKAFFFYQKRLNERLAMPFTRYFYFKKGTPADADWKLKAKERNGVAARELGGYNPYSEEGWNDEILTSQKDMTEPKYVQDVLVRDSRVRAVEGKDGAAVEVKEGETVPEHEDTKADLPEPRWTEADRQRDLKRLDRQLGRTLYLVVKRKDGGWGFPAAELVGRENLHQAAERILVQTAGVNMNTWIVGRVPIGHHVSRPYSNPSETTQSTPRPGENTFFLKGRILAGQADLKENVFGLDDFRWLTKQEVGQLVAAKYWSSVKNMLTER